MQTTSIHNVPNAISGIDITRAERFLPCSILSLCLHVDLYYMGVGVQSVSCKLRPNLGRSSRLDSCLNSCLMPCSPLELETSHYMSRQDLTIGRHLRLHPSERTNLERGTRCSGAPFTGIELIYCMMRCSDRASADSWRACLSRVGRRSV